MAEVIYDDIPEEMPEDLIESPPEFPEAILTDTEIETLKSQGLV